MLQGLLAGQYNALPNNLASPQLPLVMHQLNRGYTQLAWQHNHVQWYIWKLICTQTIYLHNHLVFYDLTPCCCILWRIFTGGFGSVRLSPVVRGRVPRSSFHCRQYPYGRLDVDRRGSYVNIVTS